MTFTCTCGLRIKDLPEEAIPAGSMAIGVCTGCSDLLIRVRHPDGRLEPTRLFEPTDPLPPGMAKPLLIKQADVLFNRLRHLGEAKLEKTEEGRAVLARLRSGQVSAEDSKLLFEAGSESEPATTERLMRLQKGLEDLEALGQFGAAVLDTVAPRPPRVRTRAPRAPRRRLH